jgi:hypothetical protein
MFVCLIIIIGLSSFLEKDVTSDRFLSKNQCTQALSCLKVPEFDFQRQFQYQEPFESFLSKSLSKISIEESSFCYWHFAILNSIL